MASRLRTSLSRAIGLASIKRDAKVFRTLRPRGRAVASISA